MVFLDLRSPWRDWDSRERGAGSGHGCTHLQPAQAHFCHWNGEYPPSGESLPSKGRQIFYPHPPVKSATKLIQWGWLKEPRAVPQAPFLASLPLRRAMGLIPRVLLPPTFLGLGGEPKPDPWDVTLLWNTNCHGCPGLFVSTIQCCLIPFCVHSGRTAGICKFVHAVFTALGRRKVKPHMERCWVWECVCICAWPSWGVHVMLRRIYLSGASNLREAHKLAAKSEKSLLTRRL